MEKTVRKLFFFLCVAITGIVFICEGAQYSGYLYFVKDNDLWVKDLSTDLTTRLTRLGTAIGTGNLVNPFISSDGTKIVFHIRQIHRLRR